MAEETQFKKGKSGNPNGRPKGSPNTATRLRKLFDIVQDKPHPITEKAGKYTALELMDAAQIVKAMAGDTIAYRELLDRFEGKVPQKSEFSTPPDRPMQFANVSVEERLQFLALADKMTGDNEQPA